MKPYFQDDTCTIYHGDCREVMPSLSGIDLVLTDPPYGIKYKSTHNTGYKVRKEEWAKYRKKDNFKTIQGDNIPFEPKSFLEFPKVALFGANYFASKLPDTKCWIVWDKKLGKPDKQADCELIWTNFKSPSRIFPHLWRGICRAGEENVVHGPKLHPHQKPLALLRYIIELSKCEVVVFDPYMGSGSTLIAAKQSRRPSIGIEIEEEYCEIAAERCRAFSNQNRKFSGC